MGGTMDLAGLLRLAATHLGTTPEKLLEMVASGELTKALDPAGQAKLAAVMQHPEQAEELLADPAVTEAVRKWQNGNGRS